MADPKKLQGDIAGLTAAFEKLSQALDNDDEKSSVTKAKTEALAKVMEELNKVSPGLGESINLLSVAYQNAAKAAAGGAVSMGSFNTALGTTLRSVGPLAIVSLSIQAAGTWWDFYKEKAETAAKAQTEAAKKIVESTHAARKAVEELNEAMNPKKKGTADQDEDQLHKKLENLENNTKRQRELNQASEEKELQNASSPEAQEKIRNKYEIMDKQLEDWQAKQKASIEGAAVAGMESQLQKLKEADDQLTKKSHAEFLYGQETGNWSKYNKTVEKLKANSAEAQSIRDKLDPLSSQQQHDATQAAFDSETTRQVLQAKGIKYNAPSAADSTPGPGFDQAKQIENALPGAVAAEYSRHQGGHALNQSQVQTISALQQMLVQAHANSDQILRLIVDGVKKQETTAQIIDEVKQQLAATSTTK